MKPFIQTQNLQFKYNDNDDNFILNNISLEIAKGEFVVILGQNGCGKSTLLKHFNALFLPSAGKVFVEGIDTSIEEKTYEIRSKVGLVLQNPDNQIVSSIVEEDVAFGPENLGIEPSEIRSRVDSALKSVNMYEYRKQDCYKLSGGQKQRLAIAGIIAMNPSCILLDEPTAMLDPIGRDEVLETVKYLNKEKNMTIVLITHFMEEAACADRIIVLDKGKILTQGTPREVFSQVELLQKHGLDVPAESMLLTRLSKSGINVQVDAIGLNECVTQLQKAIQGKVV